VRTIVYVDGYNLFYGRLRGTQYKWLDIVGLFSEIVRIQDPSSSLVQLKYFTSPAKAKFASHGQESTASQERYHRALKQTYGDQVEIISGFHTVEPGTAPKYQEPVVRLDTIDIWKFEEKQTDVNIALHMYRDAVKNRCEQLVLVTNDSDLEPALQFLTDEEIGFKIGLIIPRPKPTAEVTPRPPNKKLSNLADWTRQHILDEECEKFQLPDRIPTPKKPIDKPEYW